MKIKILLQSLLLCLFSIPMILQAQVTHINNTGGTVLSEAMLNISKQDASTTGVVDLLSLYRLTSGTAANGIGSGILFRNQASNGGLAIAGRISSIAESAIVGSSRHAFQFDVYENGFISNQLYLNRFGLGVGKINPTTMLDVTSPGSNPVKINGGPSMYLSLFEENVYRGYLGSFSGNTTDVDFGTGSGNTLGRLHLTIQASPKMTIDETGRVGIATQNPTTILDVQGPPTLITPVVRGTVNYVGTSDIVAVEGISTPADGWGYGGNFQGGYRGVYSWGNGGTYTGFTYGVYGQATGTAGTRIGVLGTASGGTTNWAGYFSGGNVYVANEVRVGTTTGAAGYKVSVDGKIMAEELRVQNSIDWPDYVFADDYALMSIAEVEKSIKANKHLPGIPSAKIVDKEGIAVGEMQIRMMEKIEEMMLYIIQQQKEIEALKTLVTEGK